MKHPVSLLFALVFFGSALHAQPTKGRSSRRSKNEEPVRWVNPNELQSAVMESSATAPSRATENTVNPELQAQQSSTPSDGVKADMLLSLRNLLNFLASSHIKTGLPTSKDSVTSPCLGYSPDGASVMVAQDTQASKWNVTNKSNLGAVNPAEVQKGSNISPDGNKKAFINGEERLIIVDTKTGEQIIGPSVAGYQIMLGKPKLSWAHITPVWCPDGNQLAIAADGLVVLVDVPHLLQVDTFIKQANPEQLTVLEKIHTAYRSFDKTGKAQLSAQDKQIFDAFPAVVTKALKPYVQ